MESAILNLVLTRQEDCRSLELAYDSWKLLVVHHVHVCIYSLLELKTVDSHQLDNIF